MFFEAWIDEEIEELREKSLERRLSVFGQAGGKIEIEGRTFLNFSSNDYLALARHPEVISASRKYLESYGCGATASRLITGTLTPHDELERAIAALKGYPRSLVFGSGFLANAGVITSLVGRNDHVFADKLAHASIIDAAALSRANLKRFRHNDPDHLRTLLSQCPAFGRKLVVTESVFSMDGDIAPLSEITSAAVESEAMVMVDEAHATGVFGPHGSGLIREYGLESKINVSMGTLSKALGGYGGFVACSPALRQLLVNRARAFIYTTGLPPAAVGSALGALAVMEKTPDQGSELLRRASVFRRRLQQAGLNTLHSQSQIVPVLIGENAKTLAVAQRLRSKGILAVAIRPPTVPDGTARLRLSITLDHSDDDLERAAGEITRAVDGD
ncbi:MAG TPA: 8-amino-7-oxononanoate synthase [Syntrophobacteraceae bacterium]|nr:8-amino-7-oxononanoate synthase [Syntrophobacteraceae bacterium]